jgi:anti-sigma B factor antagonist
MLTAGTAIEQTNRLVIASIPSREFTIRQATDLVEELMQRMRCDNAQYFLLDLAAVDFMPSACLGALVTLLQDVEHVHGRIGLVNCRPDVQFLFKVTRLDAVFPLFDDMEKAKGEIIGR